MKKIGRLLTAMVTPFDDEGKVDYPQAQKLALALIRSGSDGVVVTGTTGEAPTVTKEEKLKLFTEIKAAVGKQGVVIANTGGNSTAQSVELTKAAEKAGVDGCLMVVPYYNKPTQEGLYLHFKTIAQSTSLPCILYNVPSRTITSLSTETTLRLSQIPNMAGTKEASGNLEQIADIIRNARPDFLVWSGNDGDTFHIMSMGGYGLISVASHLVGNQIKKMMNAIVDGKTAEAASIHQHLLPLVKSLFILSNPIPVKYALNQVGFKVGKPRLPLTEPDEKSAAAIRECLKKYQLDLPV